MQGTAKLLRDLEKIKAKTRPSGGNGTHRALSGLCTMVVDRMSEAYNSKVHVDKEITTDGAIITARHPALGFIEFGTGINFNGASEYGAKLGFIPGSWSRDHEQWLTDPQKLAEGHGWWPLRGGVWTQGAPPGDAFGLAERLIREYAREYFEGAFGND